MAAALGAVAVAPGCGDDELLSEDPAPPATVAASAPPAAAQLHSATGVVVAVSDHQVTIRHEAVEDLGWPEGTRRFALRGPDQASLLRAGGRVAFTFSLEGPVSRLTSVLPMRNSNTSPARDTPSPERRVTQLGG